VSPGHGSLGEGPAVDRPPRTAKSAPNDHPQGGDRLGEVPTLLGSGGASEPVAARDVVAGLAEALRCGEGAAVGRSEHDHAGPGQSSRELSHVLA
jgi:hypothetical protein